LINLEEDKIVELVTYNQLKLSSLLYYFKMKKPELYTLILDKLSGRLITEVANNRETLDNIIERLETYKLEEIEEEKDEDNPELKELYIYIYTFSNFENEYPFKMNIFLNCISVNKLIGNIKIDIISKEEEDIVVASKNLGPNVLKEGLNNLSFDMSAFKQYGLIEARIYDETYDGSIDNAIPTFTTPLFNLSV